MLPANEASRADLEAVFGQRGEPARCRCQWFTFRDSEWRGVPLEERAALLRSQSRCGHPSATSTSGLVAHLDGEPVG
ncbi:hypothetical protein ACEXQE_18405 [Herbiconiux sp. P17]|uniref:hypothetical protein n=1 Tax=Herbiconiux wuyangfengii TaxID=3342794 RepID=UPI0035B9C1D6